MSTHSAFSWLAGAALCTLSLACSKPEPPELTPLSATVSEVGTTGVKLQLRLSARNPNSYELSAQSVAASVVFDGTINAGTVNTNVPINLPANASTELTVPLDLSWAGVAALTTLALQKPEVPFVVSGDVAIGGKSINVKLPYSVEGKVTREQFAGAAVNSFLGGVGGQILQGLQQAGQQAGQQLPNGGSPGGQLLPP